MSTHTVWSCLIIILPLLINELVLAVLCYHLFLFVDFLNQHLRVGIYCRVGGLSPWGNVLGPDCSLLRVSLVSKAMEDARLPSLFSPCLEKLSRAHYFNYLTKHCCIMSCFVVYMLIIKL